MIQEIIKSKNLGFDEARDDRSIKIVGEGTKYPDCIIYKKFPDKPVCVIEIESPDWDASHFKLINNANKEASHIGARFFATWNIRDFILWETFVEDVPLLDRRKWWETALLVKDISEVDRPENWNKIRSFLENFLTKLDGYVYKREKFVGLPIDEFFIRKLKATVDINTPVFTYALKQKCLADGDYYKRLIKWVTGQGWHPDLKPKAENTDPFLYEKMARIAVYILANKILFYNIVKSHNSNRLKAIATENIKTPADLNQILKNHFRQVLDINYDTIYEIKIFDELKIHPSSIERVKKFIEDFDQYDFKGVNYEILGRVYEDLIPEADRHEMGQYFTPSTTVDLINSFCVQDSDDIVLDLGCGAGTFLIRAYARLKYLEKKKHKELLEQLWGVDIASFPAHLSTINLVLPDLTETQNFPYILNMDAFDVKPLQTFLEVPKHSGIKYETMRVSDKNRVKVKMPEVNVVVGNPPYIEQKSIENKEAVRRTVMKDWGELRISNQSDIYVYFFIHGAKFLKREGRLGFVTSNSWLDIRFGGDLQKFLLDNFIIVAIIQSQVERSFAKADINTAITIVERCYNRQERESNTVKFVTLKQKLDEIIKGEDEDRFKACDKLINKIQRAKTLYDDENMRVFPKSQKELYEEGTEDRQYAGSKWGKFVRAPDIFFELISRKKDFFRPISVLVDNLRRGFTTNKDEFFYLTDEQIKAHKIENEFLKPVITTPKECDSVIVKGSDLRHKVLFVNKEKDELRGKNVLKYIKWGEEKGFNKNPSFIYKTRWYDLGKITFPAIIFRRFFDVKFNLPLLPDRIFDNQTFYGLCIQDPNYAKVLAAILNSTLSALFIEISGRLNLGEGVLQYAVYEAGQLLVLDPDRISQEDKKKLQIIFDQMSKRPTLPIFQEIEQEDKQKLDEIIFNILGLSENERQNVYTAICVLVKNRVEKAKTFGKTVKGKKEEFNPVTYAEHILSEVFNKKEKKEFPKDFVSKSWDTITIELPSIDENMKLRIEEFFGKASLRIDGMSVDCHTPSKASFVELAIQKGVKDSVVVPADDRNCIKAIKEYQQYRKEIEAEIEETIQMFNLTQKKAKAVWTELENKF
ncbi:MAG: N-6 DNA methylase [candidate division Zixibacteria bacterium RBG-1]|nr:MAG: N-6 DNA methylase [candidate division Zixibacteria bacterium RBG-1]OGC83549.1 MAG: hypothetical protein A2V73_05455 [candidate division Zixibacteria bacterium RBG_19FT_COMBO_42_43]